MTQAMTSPSTQPAKDQAGILQSTLVELIELSLQAKQAHWNLVGATFKSVHELLDELTDEYRAWYDVVAERLAALGIPPDGRSTTLADSKPFDQLPDGQLQIAKVILLFDERTSALAMRLHERVDQLADIDQVSQGILLDVLAGIEKQRWMIRAHAA